jgi:streptomycin 6-kinase
MPFATPSSVLQPVLFEQRPAYLKIATVDEEAAGNRVLVWWNGRGAAPVFAHEDDAVVMERATGVRDLATLARSGPEGDDAATRILCRAGLRLHTIDDRPLPVGLLELNVWFRELFAHASEHPEAHGGFYSRAASVARTLLAEPAGRVVLHGDLHHGNVLDFAADGWLAIDPKHIIGDPGFDFANILCNPDAEVALSPGALARRLDVISETTGIDRHRMLAWAVAWTGLSSCWSERSGLDPAHTRTLGLTTQRMLGLC